MESVVLQIAVEPTEWNSPVPDVCGFWMFWDDGRVAGNSGKASEGWFSSMLW